ncbi:MAG: ABC transporter substrate-binding protein [Candidatus Omnitrophica bacterium]|nr:ABC transporter substrate-binding protein [Candidatus Omnitrophota bacterium]
MKKFLPILTFLMIFILVLSGCTTTDTTTSTSPTSTSTTSSTSTSSEPQYGGVLTVIDIEFISGPFGYLPETLYNASTFILPCVESFFSFDNQGIPIGRLATSWEFSEDYSSLTFYLREGVTFHDGSTFNAEAAKWNLDLMLAKGDTGTEVWEDVVVVDEYTLRIDLKRFNCMILSNIPNLTRCTSPTAFETLGIEGVRYNPVGTGPFKFKEYKEGESVEYERYDAYWDGKPYLDGVKFIYIKDRTTAELALQGGEANGLHCITSAHLSARTLGLLGYQIIQPPSSYATLYFDTKSEDSIFNDQRVREAVEYAINREQISETCGYGYWFAMNQCAVPTENGYIANFEGREYSPEKAKALLAETGLTNIRTTIYVPNHMSGDHMVAIQSYLSAVGIDASIEVITSARWMELQYGPGGFNGILYSPYGSSDVDSTVHLDRCYGLKASSRLSNRPPEGMADIVAQLLVEPDLAKRGVLCREATLLFWEQCTKVALWNQPAMYAFDQTVHDTGITEWYLPFQFNWNKVWMSQ